MVLYWISDGEAGAYCKVGLVIINITAYKSDWPSYPFFGTFFMKYNRYMQTHKSYPFSLFNYQLNFPWIICVGFHFICLASTHVLCFLLQSNKQYLPYIYIYRFIQQNFILLLYMWFLMVKGESWSERSACTSGTQAGTKRCSVVALLRGTEC